MELEGYVIKNHKLKEKDTILTLLTEKGLITIYGSNYRSLKSKYHALNNLYLKIKIYGIEGKYFKVRDYDIIDTSFQNSFSYEELVIIIQIVDILIKVDKESIDGNIYFYFEEILQLIKEKKYDITTLLYIFLVQIVKSNEINLNFKSCVICGTTTNFSTFSVYDGGLICKDCQKKIPFKSLESIRRLNYLFTVGEIRIILKKIGMIKIEEKREILYLLNESLGVYLRSDT